LKEYEIICCFNRHIIILNIVPREGL